MLNIVAVKWLVLLATGILGFAVMKESQVLMQLAQLSLLIRM